MIHEHKHSLFYLQFTNSQVEFKGNHSSNYKDNPTGLDIQFFLFLHSDH